MVACRSYTNIYTLDATTIIAHADNDAKYTIRGPKIITDACKDTKHNIQGCTIQPNIISHAGEVKSPYTREDHFYNDARGDRLPFDH